MLFNSDLSLAESFEKIKTIEMHTGGEPVRIVTSGFPSLSGSILDIRRELTENYDHLRKAIMWEPRGHADMYGLLVTPPEREDSDFGVIFMHNEGYSTMCGHATLAISNAAAQLKWIPLEDPETIIKIDAPCGQLTSFVHSKDGIVTNVAFENVPSFVVELDAIVHHQEYGSLKYDLAYGGAFYAYMDVNQLGLRVEKTNYRKFIELGIQLKQSIIESNSNIIHPYEKDLSFLYGVIFTEQVEDKNIHSRNVCVFADGEVDRCATGSGVSGRAAIHYAKDELKVGQEITIESIIGSSLTVEITSTCHYGNYNAVVPKVSGSSYFIGSNEFWLDDSDILGKGFLLR